MPPSGREGRLSNPSGLQSRDPSYGGPSAPLRSAPRTSAPSRSASLRSRLAQARLAPISSAEPPPTQVRPAHIGPQRLRLNQARGHGAQPGSRAAPWRAPQSAPPQQDGRAPSGAVTAAAVVSDHGEAREPERAHDHGLTGGHGARAAACFRPWREGCECPQSRCRGSRSPEGRLDGITLPCPALRLTPAQAREALARSCRVQRTPSSPQRGLANGGTTVDPTREQPALFPTGSLVLLGLLTVQLLRTLDTKLR